MALTAQNTAEPETVVGALRAQGVPTQQAVLLEKRRIKQTKY